MSKNKPKPFGEKDLDSLFLSVDVETDGPIPGPFSLRNLGAVALNLRGQIFGSFEINFAPLPGAGQNPSTMEFWGKNPDAWARVTADQVEAEEATRRYRAFIDGLPKRPMFLGFPAGFDFLFHTWYLIRFTGEDPTGFAPFDLKSYGAGSLGLPFRESAKRNYPADWFGDLPHSHTGLDDAMGQGLMGINMIRHRQGYPPLDKFTTV